MDSLHQLLESSARRRPDAVAVEDPERETSITYRDLDTRAERMRDALIRNGVAPGDRVGIRGAKSIGTLAAMLGTLKAGAAYVPLDPGAPPERNAYISNDCSVKALVGPEEGVGGLLPGRDRPGRDRPGRDRPGRDRPEPAGSSRAGFAGARVGSPADPLAYILYTSGSTGQPKGVMHTHGSALSFLGWCSETFDPEQDDRFSSHAPLHFDLSILDVFLAFKHGATLILIGEQLGKEPLRLAPFIARQRISVWYSTPSVLRLLVQYGKLDRYDCSALRAVLFAGEVFPLKHLRALQQVWPGPAYFNLYGPTETNVCTYHELPAKIPEERSEPLPIGGSCSHCRTRVVDEHGGDVERGQEGELQVSGAPVTPGYWNLPERTAEAFSVDTAGRRWYRTGDLVREAVAGSFLFLGRRDRMVKRLGYRVELGEIEAALHRHPQIAAAAVIARPDEESGVYLTAFVSCPDPGPPSVIGMKQFCARILPSYMIPDRFSFTASLPRTSTGKIDYQSLIVRL